MSCSGLEVMIDYMTRLVHAYRRFKIHKLHVLNES